ncbi:unnamed protein product [Miscanthus lutarioriparius]|uniref:Pentatricopeptide repeat-containing protein n=1 Tax=Miscanthus lutarioriparius TaxID=422564 RepID=A0A811QFY7_9POAL|nr:unnamed protein product [Miscanthus lutarioriparius]
MGQQGLSPDVVSYGALIDALCKVGRVDDAVLKFNQMINEGGHCLVGRIDEAAKSLDFMLLVGLKPNEWAYNTLLHGYCNARMIDDANSVFEKCCATALLPELRFSKAKELYLNMIKNEKQWDIYTYNIILNGLYKNNCVDEAFKMFQSFCSKDLQVDIFTFTIMIGALLKGGRKEDAMDLFATISSYGLVPNVVTYCLIAQNLIEEGSLQKFDDLFSAMGKSGMLNALVRRLLHRGDITRAGAYLSKLDEKNFSLEASTIAMLISLFSREEYQHHAKSLPEKYRILNEAKK